MKTCYISIFSFLIFGCASINPIQRQIATEQDKQIKVTILLNDFALVVEENSKELVSFPITYGGKKLFKGTPVFIDGIGTVNPKLHEVCNNTLEHPPRGDHAVTALLKTYRSAKYQELVFQNVIKFKGFLIREQSLPNQIVGEPSFTCSMIVLTHEHSERLFSLLSTVPQENILIIVR